MHKSRLGTVIIDCLTDDLEQEAEFWSAALGCDVERRDEEGRFIGLQTSADDPRVVLQKVEHSSRIHIDIETDDVVAEVKRLSALGATVVDKMERWTVMQAPSGHRFCIIGPNRKDFETGANNWP